MCDQARHRFEKPAGHAVAADIGDGRDEIAEAKAAGQGTSTVGLHLEVVHHFDAQGRALLFYSDAALLTLFAGADLAQLLTLPATVGELWIMGHLIVVGVHSRTS